MASAESRAENAPEGALLAGGTQEYGTLKSDSAKTAQDAEKGLAKEKKGGAPVYLGALDFMRFFSAVHILGFHNQSHLHGREQFFRLGDTWVPYFFILSAFVTSFAQLNRKEPSNVGEFLPFLKKRLIGVYPLFFLAMLLALFAKVYIPYMELDSNAFDVLLNVLLLQTWRPWVTHQTLNVNLPSWFVSALAFQWVIYYFTFPAITKLSVKSVFGVLGATAFATWFKANTLYEYSLGPWGFPNKYNPFMNIDFCVYGMCLAMLFKNWVDTHQDGKDFLAISCGGRRFAFSGLLGFFGLMFVFFFRRERTSQIPLELQLGVFGPIANVADLGARFWRRTSRLVEQPKAILLVRTDFLRIIHLSRPNHFVGYLLVPPNVRR